MSESKSNVVSLESHRKVNEEEEFKFQPLEDNELGVLLDDDERVRYITKITGVTSDLVELILTADMDYLVLCGVAVIHEEE